MFRPLRVILTPISIKNNPFLKLILIEQTPLLTCFGFVTRQKWLVLRRFNLKKALLLIDVGVKLTYSLDVLRLRTPFGIARLPPPLEPCSAGRLKVGACEVKS